MDDRPPTSQKSPYQASAKAAIEDIASLLAERPIRLAASIIDGLVLGLVNFSIQYVPALFGARIFNDIAWIIEHPFLFVILNLVYGIVIFTIINFPLLCKNGQTVGKYACKIKIVRTDHSPADVDRIVFYRYLPIWIAMSVLSIWMLSNTPPPDKPFIPTLTDFIPLFLALILMAGNYLLIFRKSRKCLHDDIADTIVIKA
ncbi:MAG: RDD family protein [Betaproteobacteria bacterium]|nr:RDD family protein [Betaproteobacteria bacterium]